MEVGFTTGGVGVEIMIIEVGCDAHLVQTIVLVKVMVLVSVTGTVKVEVPEVLVLVVTDQRQSASSMHRSTRQCLPGQVVVTIVMVLVVGTGVVGTGVVGTGVVLQGLVVGTTGVGVGVVVLDSHGVVVDSLEDLDQWPPP